jgi:hypothetical protein
MVYNRGVTGKWLNNHIHDKVIIVRVIFNVFLAVQEGHADKIFLSNGVYFKMQLARFGGYRGEGREGEGGRGTKHTS